MNQNGDRVTDINTCVPFILKSTANLVAEYADDATNSISQDDDSKQS